MQKEEASLTNDASHHSVALNNSPEALEEEFEAHRATVSAFGIFDREVSDLEAQNLSLKDPNQKLTQKTFSATKKTTGKRCTVS